MIYVFFYFFVNSQGCSGDYGTERLWSPLYYTNNGVRLQSFPEEVPVNITVPSSITGRGGIYNAMYYCATLIFSTCPGTIEMYLQYTCESNFCSSKYTLVSVVE